MERDSSQLTMRNAITSRKRSGSFTGQMTFQQSETTVGRLEYAYSRSNRELEVTDIANLRKSSTVRGLGTVMHQQAEEHAMELNARRMKAVTSQPGFFKKMGYDYTTQQQGLNRELGLSQEKLTTIESTPQKERPGFEMEKILKRKDSCSIM